MKLLLMMMLSNEEVLNCHYGHISGASQRWGLIYLCFKPVPKIPLFSAFGVAFCFPPKIPLPARGTGEQEGGKCSELSTQTMAVVSATCLQSRLWPWILVLPGVSSHYSADSGEGQLKSWNSLGVGSAHSYAADFLCLGSFPCF